MQTVEQRIYDLGVIPVVTLRHPQTDAVPLAKTLQNSGLPAAEVTFRREGAAEAIRLMRKACPELLLGAGTILTTAQIDAALEAGAEFIVTPGFDPQLVAYCQSKCMPIFPGCTTASDYHAAFKFGLTLLKFFPAEQSGGLAKIKALSAPFPMFRIMPTGGISLQNLAQYLSCPLIAACGGSYMVSSQLLEAQDWDEIAALCRQTAAIVKQIRS
ncbi:MAG: bifunctional 4-hydroxy-2-oxoglutarate aldolase/2-dehydro-3-deoxy-phosphogluconate aldolase [Faecousia sp.]